MLNQNSLEQSIQTDQLEQTLPQSNFTFTPIEDMFESPDMDRADAMMLDPGGVTNVRAAQEMINRYSIVPTTNISNPLPGSATTNFDPYSQSRPPQPGSYESSKQIMQGDLSEGKINVSPIAFDVKSSNFRRYYEHPEYKNLGFVPYADMETYYNANSNIMDDLSRMSGELGALGGAAFMSSYRTAADVMAGDWDSVFSGDDETAEAFEEAMMVGNSTRGGFGGFANNFFLNSAYTGGIIASIAVEELAMVLGTSALGLSTIPSGGTTTPAAGAAVAGTVARSGWNIFRGVKTIGQGIKNSFYANKFLKKLKDVQNAKNFWQGSINGTKVLGQAFTPNTLFALKRWNTTKTVAQNSRNIANTTKLFGGFYRDLRAVNLAVSEGRLEGGMVANNLVNSEVTKREARGETVTDKDMQEIISKSHEAAFETMMINAPIIYASNWFVLGNALGGYRRTLGMTIREGYQNVGKRILRTRKSINPKTGLPNVGKMFKDRGTGISAWWNGVKAGGVRGSAGLIASSSLRYFANNIAEGVQEVSQEAVAAATTGYYSAILDDPLSGGWALRKANIKAGMGEQLSGQGFEVFMSGFLMGGFVQGPQKLLFQGIPSLYKYGGSQVGLTGLATEKQKEAFQEFRDAKEKTVQTALDALNNTWDNMANDPLSVFDPKMFNLTFQKQLSNDLRMQEDLYNIVNMQDESRFANAHAIFETGTSHLFIDQIKDFMQLDDKALYEAGFGFTPTQIKNGKAREKLQDQIDNIKEMQTDYNNFRDEFPNLFNPAQYPPESEDYKRAVLQSRAWDHSRMLLMFTKNSMVRAAERAASINSRLQNEPLFKNMSASDLTVLTSKESLVKEMQILTDEISLLKAGEQTDKVKKDLAFKTKKLDLIAKFFTTIINPKNRTKDGKGPFDRRKMKTIEKPFQAYVQFLASQSQKDGLTQTFVDPTEVRKALIDIIDYTYLDGNIGIYNRALLYLMKPENFDEIYNRTLSVVEERFENNYETTKKNLEKYIDIQLANKLINELMSQEDVVVAGDESAEFLQTGDSSVLKNFFTQYGQINATNDKAKWLKIQAIIANYNRMVSKSDQAQNDAEVSEAEVSEVTNKEQEEILSDAGISVVLKKPNNTPMLNSLLNRSYNKYAALTSSKNEPVDSFNKWRSSEEAKLIQTTFNNIKKVWAQGYDSKDSEGNTFKITVSERQVTNEEGFAEFLLTREAIEDPIVQKLLSEAGLTLNDIIDDSDGAPVSKTARPANEGKGPFMQGTKFDVTKVDIDPEPYFELRDKNNNPLKEDVLSLLPKKFKGFIAGIYNTADSASDALNYLDSLMPDDSAYLFDGYTIHLGETVIDRDGQEWLVKSTPKMVSDKGRILLRKKEDNDKNPADVEPMRSVGLGNFRSEYTLQERDVQALTDDFAKLNFGKNVEIYPRVFDNEQSLPDKFSRAQRRLAVILSSLSAEEIQTLNLVIERDPKSGEIKGPYVIPTNPTLKKPNPQLIQAVSVYKIGFSLPLILLDKVNDKLQKENLGALEEGVVFGYVDNGNYAIKPTPESLGLDPRNITIKEVKNIINNATFPEGMQDNELVQSVQDMFTTNILIATQAGKLLGDNNKISISFDSEDMINFDIRTVLTGAIIDFDNVPKPVSELEYQFVNEEGDTFIFDVKRNKGQFKSINEITSVDNDPEFGVEERRKLIDDTVSGLKSQQIYEDKILNGTDRYYLIVKAPNGTYGFATLQAKQLTSDEFSQLAFDLIDQAEKKQEDNKGKTKVQQESSTFNNKFNDEIARDIFIKSNKGGYTVSIQVNPYGEVQMQLYDKNNKKDVATKTPKLTRDEVNDPKISVEAKLVTLISRLNEEIESTGVVITPAKFSKGFPEDATYDEILDKTTTKTATNVFKGQKVRLNANSAGIDAGRGVPDAANASGTFQMTEPYSGKPIGPVLQTPARTSNEAENSVLDITETEYTDMVEGNVPVPVAFLDQIAEVKRRGGEFSLREQGIYDTNSEIIDMKVAIAPNPTTASTNPNQKFDDAVSTVEKQIRALRDPVTGEVSDKNRAKFKSLTTQLYEAKSAARRGNSTQPLGTKTKGKDSNGDIIYLNSNEKAVEDKSIESYIKTIDKGIKNGKITLEKGREMVLKRITKDYDFSMDKMGIIVDYIQDRLDGSIPQVGNNKSSWLMFRDGKQPGLPVKQNNINIQIEELKVSLLEGVAPRDHFKTLQKNEEYQKLLKERDRQDKGLVNKILSGVFTPVFDDLDIVNINDFMMEAERILPDFISIEDIAVLGDNMKAGGVRVGAFQMYLNDLAGGLNVKGTIYTGAQNPFKYHEAFHAVYRLLLTPEQQKRLQSVARKEVRAKLRAEGKSFEKELQKFKNSANTYSDMSRKQLEKLYYEEYMSDEFDKFKINPRNTNTNTEVKSLFNRIIEFIKAFIDRFTTSQLQRTFEDIDAGKYKNASVVSNEFTESVLNDGPIIANALVPFKKIVVKDTEGFDYLDGNIADMIVRGIAASYLARSAKAELPYNPKDIFDEVVDDYQWLYSPNNEVNDLKTDEQKEKLKQIESAFLNYSTLIIEQADNLLEMITDKSVIQEENIDNVEDSVGVRTVSQYDLDASLIGGLKAIPSDVRKYIALTSVSEKDFFGNEYLTKGERIIVPVDFVDAFNSILKSTSNITNPLDFLKSMYFFGEDNVQGGAIVRKLLHDVGYSSESLLTDESFPAEIQNSSLLQSFINGFTNVRLDYLFVERSLAGDVRIYTASQKDDINSQLTRWQQAYYVAKRKLRADSNKTTNVINQIKDFDKALKGSNEMTDKALDKMSKAYSQDLYDNVGIKLSSLFIKVSLLQNRNGKTKKQKSLKKLYSDAKVIQDSGTGSDFSTMSLLSEQLQSNQDIFDEKGGILGRLRELSIANAPFDETVGATIHRNSNGDLVYAHQKPTFNLLFVNNLNNIDFYNNLLADPYKEQNFLLNSEAFKKMSQDRQIRMLRMEGSKVASGALSESNVEDGVSIDNTDYFRTQTYGNFSPKEFSLTQINLYTAFFNTKSGRVDTVIDSQGNESAIAPIFPKVMEASNTSELIGLPVIKTVEGSNAIITDETLDLFLDGIKNEFTRINRESNIDTATETVLGYNDVGGRGFSFFNNTTLLSQEFKNELSKVAYDQGQARNTISFDDAIKFTPYTLSQIREDIRTQLNNEYSDYVQYLIDENIYDEISKKVKDGLVVAEGVSRNNVNESSESLNLIPTNARYNLRQIFFNQKLNAAAFNEAQHGDQARLFKSSADITKRAKGNNNAGTPAYSEVIDTKKGILHTTDDISYILFEEPIENNIDIADAQGYTTVKGFRHLKFGTDSLSTGQAQLLDAMEDGLSESYQSSVYFGNEETPIGLVQDKDMVNSKKYAYFDGQKYLKFTITTLFKEYTSNLNPVTQVWEAKPGMLTLHNLRVAMEKIDASKDTITVAGPLSASKAEKMRVVPLSDINDNIGALEVLPHSTLSAKHMRLQQITPSNQLEGPDPTQIAEIITNIPVQFYKTKVPGLRDLNGDALDLKQIITAYNEVKTKKFKLSFNNKRNLIYEFESAVNDFNISNNTDITPKLAAFLKFAEKSLKAGKTSTNLLEFFSSVDGKQNYNLNNPITAPKFEQLFLNYFAKGVFSQKVPMVKLTLVSPFGVKKYRRVYDVEIVNGETIPTRSEIVRDKVFDRLGLTVEKDLQDLTPGNIPAKGYIVLDRLRVVPVYSNPKNPNSYTGERAMEMQMPAHHSSVRDLIENTNAPIPNVIARQFAVRIPTDDFHSSTPSLLVDFMPTAMGSVGMYAQELIEIAGSDHDGDKTFAHIKDFYVQDGVFKEYGKTKNKREEYLEYVRYSNRLVKAKGSQLQSVFELYSNNELDARIDSSPDSAVIDIATDPIDKQGGGMLLDTAKALAVLGLPISPAQYSEYKLKYGYPFEAPFNNQLLDYKFALVGNESMTTGNNPISYTPTSEEPINAALKLLEEKEQKIIGLDSNNYFRDKRADTPYDPSSFLGQAIAFQDNKGASIGASVLPNLYLSNLVEAGSEITDKTFTPIIDGITYNSFDPGSVEQAKINQDGKAAIVSMTVDNPTNRFVGKAGFNKHATSLAMNMLSLGMPMETIILLINTPTIRQVYKNASESNYSPYRVNKEIKKAFAVILNTFDDKKPSVPKLTSEMMSDYINANYNENLDPAEFYDVDLSILREFAKASRLQEFTNNMAAVTGLTKGLGKSMQNISRRKKQIEKLFDKDAPINLNKVFGPNTWHGTYIEGFNLLTNNLLPATFLRSSIDFQEILSLIADQMDLTNQATNEEMLDKISLDLLSYLTIKGYRNNMMENESHVVGGLTNDILYPSKQENIVDIVNRLKETPEGVDNDFLNGFLIVTDSKNSKSGLNLAEANTFRVMNSLMKVDLQNGFSRLYGSPNTRQDAMNLVSYMMVKDGLQIGYGTLLDAVNPYILNKYLSHVNTVNDALRGKQSIDTVFGQDIRSLINEFIKGYTVAAASNDKVFTLSSSDVGVSIEITPEGTQSLVVDWLEYYRDLGIEPIRNDKGFYRGPRLYSFNYLVQGEDGPTVSRAVAMEEWDVQDIQKKMTVTYSLESTKGSPRQNGIGFMFGDLISTNDLNKYRSENQKSSDIMPGETMAPISSYENAVKEMALKQQNSNITAVQGTPMQDSGIKVKLDPEAKETNIEDTAKLAEQISANSEAVEEDERQAYTIEDVDTSNPEMTDPQTSLFNELKLSLEEIYPVLYNFWTDTINPSAENRKIMRAQGAGTFKKFIGKFNDKNLKYESEQDYVEDVKKCILKK